MLDVRTKLPTLGQAVLVLVLVATGLVVGRALASEGDPPAVDFDPRDEPAEYLYLDARRVLTYLPQALGGLPGNETQSLTNTRSLTLDLKGTAGPSVGSTQQEQRTSERTLTATAASRFFVLLDELADGGKLHELEFSRLDENAETLNEGDFVRIRNIGLVMPAYASDYDIHKTRKDVIAASGKRAYKPWQRRALNAFIASAGKDPRVSFQVESELAAAGDPRGVTLLIPAQYSLLAVEPTLLTGRQTLVGKVMRNLSVAEDQPLRFASDRYTDTATLASFRPALRALPRFAIKLHTDAAMQSLEQTRRRLGLDRDNETYQDRLREFRTSPLRSRKSLLRQLHRQTTVTSPGLVVLPLAIYK
jgi:hypothetical protein